MGTDAGRGHGLAPGMSADGGRARDTTRLPMGRAGCVPTPTMPDSQAAEVT